MRKKMLHIHCPSFRHHHYCTVIFTFVWFVIGLIGSHNANTVSAFHVTKPVPPSNTGVTCTRPTTTCLNSIPRRDLLGGIASGAFIGSAGSAVGPQEAKVAAVAADARSTVSGLVADMPMTRLKLPQAGFGREYVVVQLKIQDQGPFDFMIDSGLTLEMMTPHLQQLLASTDQSNLSKSNVGKNIMGISAGGQSAVNTIIDLKDAALVNGNFFPSNGNTSSELKLPTLHAIVTDFPQEHIDPAHDPVEGMLGMELLSLFDVDFDFPNNRLRFYQPGTFNKDTDTASRGSKDLVEIPALVINETGLLGFRLTVPGMAQPVLAFLDCGSTFSCMNWKAAEVLGLPSKQDPSYRNGPAISAMGIDGKPMLLPTIKQKFTFVGNAQIDPSTKRPIGFEAPPQEWKPWNEVRLAIGDLPAFSSMLGDGITPYQGPAVLLGLDVLAQRRVILKAGQGNDRRRRILVSPK